MGGGDNLHPNVYATYEGTAVDGYPTGLSHSDDIHQSGA
jgi:hypothetical protein